MDITSAMGALTAALVPVLGSSLPSVMFLVRKHNSVGCKISSELQENELRRPQLIMTV